MRLYPGFLIVFVLVSLIFAARPVAATGCDKPLTIAMFDWRRDAAVPVPASHAYEFDQALWAQVFDMLGCQVTWSFLPAKRLLAGVEKGTIDGAIPGSIAPGRERFARFTRPYRTVELVGIVRSENLDVFQIATVADLRRSNLRIGMALGGWYGKELTQLLADAPTLGGRLLTSDSGPIILGWVNSGRVDVSIMTRSISRYFIGQLGFEATLSPYPAVYDRHGFHLMLSKASISAEQTQAFDEALARFLASDANASLRQRFDIRP